jgi:ribose-phosphate pyrophosphokinase
VKRAEAFREALSKAMGRPVSNAFAEKYRSAGVLSGEAVVGSVAGKTAIVMDDLISSGSTLARAAHACLERGANEVYAAATHGVFASNATGVLSKSHLKRVVITNSIPPFRLAPEFVHSRLEVLDVAPLFAEAIRRIHTGGSIVDLLQ